MCGDKGRFNARLYSIAFSLSVGVLGDNFLELSIFCSFFYLFTGPGVYL